MPLSIKDRLKAVFRVMRIAADPNVDYINLMWRSQSQADRQQDGSVLDLEGKKVIYTHTFFMPAEKPVNTLLAYMAFVAAKSENIDELNQRCEYYLNKVAVAYKYLNSTPEFELQCIKEPIRRVPAGKSTTDDA